MLKIGHCMRKARCSFLNPLQNFSRVWMCGVSRYGRAFTVLICSVYWNTCGFHSRLDNPPIRLFRWTPINDILGFVPSETAACPCGLCVMTVAVVVGYHFPGLSSHHSSPMRDIGTHEEEAVAIGSHSGSRLGIYLVDSCKVMYKSCCHTFFRISTSFHTKTIPTA